MNNTQSNGLMPIVSWLDKVFIQRARQDIKAYGIAPTEVGGKWAYKTDRTPITGIDVQDHVLGTKPMAILLQTPEFDGGTRLAVVDIDDKKHKFTWTELCVMARTVSFKLESQGLLPFVVRSGSGHGIHLWLLWQDHQDAATVRKLLKDMVKEADLKAHVDVFPAQDSLNGGLGAHIALPLSRLSRPLRLVDETVIEDLAKWLPVEPGLSRPIAEYRPIGSISVDGLNVDGLNVDDLEQDAGKGIDLASLVDKPLLDPEFLADALKTLDASDYQTWMKYGLAIKGAVEDKQLAEEEGFKLWDDWAKSCGEKYSERAQEQEWRRFRPRDKGVGTVTIGTIIHEAKEAGWKPPRLETVMVDPVLLETKPIVKTAKPVRVNALRDREMVWRGGSGGDHIDLVNGEYFIATDGGDVALYTEQYDDELDRHKIIKLSVTGFKTYYQNQQVQVGTRGRNPVYRSLAELWLESPYRRTYREIVLKPGNETCHPWQYNLWQGWSIEPSESGSWDLLKEHIYANICRRDHTAYEYLMNWLAYTFQRPSDPIGVAVVLRGNKGTGKSFFVRAVGQLFDKHFLQVFNPKSLTGQFNSHLRGCIMLFSDEAVWAGSRTEESTLKALITEPVLMIEKKGQDVVTAKNMLHIVMATNHDWAVPASFDERRFFCLNVGNEAQGKGNYFNAIDKELKAGGSARMLWDLLHHDISKFNPQRVPMTDELMEQVIQSLPPDGKWWFHRLTEGSVHHLGGDWTSETAAHLVYEDYIKFCQGYGERYLGAPEYLSKCMAQMIGTKIETKKKKIGGQVMTFWSLPNLKACREAFAKRFRVKIVWDDGTYVNIDSPANADDKTLNF